MAKRSDPADLVVTFFSEASPEAVRIVFPIIKGIVSRRGLLNARASTKKKERPARAPDAPQP